MALRNCILSGCFMACCKWIVSPACVANAIGLIFEVLVSWLECSPSSLLHASGSLLLWPTVSISGWALSSPSFLPPLSFASVNWHMLHLWHFFGCLKHLGRSCWCFTVCDVLGHPWMWQICWMLVLLLFAILISFFVCYTQFYWSGHHNMELRW